MRIGILNCSDIAKRRIIPAMKEIDGLDISIICSSNIESVKEYASRFDIKEWTTDKTELIGKVDAVYISSPPSEHYYWCKKFLENGINVLCEKSLTLNLEDTEALINLANRNGLIIQENYGFQFHDQWKYIKASLNDIGNIQYIRSSFEFPPRDKTSDFRYKKELGGGALFDAGGYPIKVISLLIDIEDIELVDSNIIYEDDVDISGNMYIKTDKFPSFVTWSFSSSYKCNLEICGDKGTIFTDKLFTSKPDEIIEISIKDLFNHESIMTLSCDHFEMLIRDFIRCVLNKDNSHHIDIINQAKLQSYAKTTSI